VNCNNIIGVAIHELAFSDDDQLIYDTLLKMNSAIWDALQHGSVVVHCLAGLHRYCFEFWDFF
jgi:hypothetical protein